jgi:hypothetical protein
VLPLMCVCALGRGKGVKKEIIDLRDQLNTMQETLDEKEKVHPYQIH